MITRGWKFCVAAALGMVLVLGASAARAESLSTLIATDGSLTLGDKVFSDFTFVSNAGTISAASLAVNTFLDLDGNIGIRISGAMSDPVGGGPTDVTLTYIVTVTDPSQKISAAHLSGNPALSGNANGFVNVTENFFGLPNQMEIFRGPGGAQILDNTTFIPPQSQLLVEKDIFLDSGSIGPANPVNISFIDQVFEQVPEPWSISLGLCGAFGAVFLVRRMRRS